MKDHEFIRRAKAAAYAALPVTRENVTLDPERIQVVWYGHVLGHKKCTIAYVGGDDNHYIEVTYNMQKCEMYVDVYEKVMNQKIDIPGLRI